ncbi:MAG TPA: FAD-dependent monooxygenase [Burkholderiales bacterium]|nr:FAD-dependent monooxygenase [Burkholderiales bacterium]
MRPANPGRALVIGGSIAGLIAGNLLHRAGWDVHVFERASGDLEGRGAGITILPGLVSSFQAAGVDQTERSLGIELPARIALDRAGRAIVERVFAQSMTSWGRLYQALRNVYPADRYHGGMALERVEQHADRVSAVFAGGQRVESDLLIGADGLRSTVRSQFLPELQPYYSGYLAWRCLADERDLTPEVFAPLFNRYTVCVAPGEQGIGYPVPGPDHSVAPGRRQYNVVWYHPVREAEELPRFMTDDRGRCHPNGIPPSLLSSAIRDEMVGIAPGVLAPQFAEALRRGKLHFFQPILDIEPQRLAFGRVAIIGDAAFVARPHVAMGVPKGAGDALALVQSIAAAGGDVPAGLQRFEAERLRVGRTIVARGRYLGAYMEAQLKSEAERRAAEAQREPERVMMETAAPLDYDAMAQTATGSTG